MKKIAALIVSALVVVFMTGCAHRGHIAPGQLKKHTAPGHMKKY